MTSTATLPSKRRRTPGAAEARRSRQRFALLLGCALLTFLVFSQSPGLATTDTKLDLVVSPWEFLQRGAVFWNPLVDGGVVQNQAYGYLFPMGPTFGAMFSLGIPAWAAQRLWESILVCGAFLATTRLARELRVRGFVPQIAAGLVYALSPRVISELTSISSELMPMVALPLMMIPLVRASRSGSPRHGAVLAGAAFALAGGVNAAASLAILPVPALWLLTRRRSKRRGILTRWFALAVALASAWWAVPLLVLGRYSPPFLDWIEGASTTSAPLSAFNIARGSTQWVSYLGPGTWPGGWTIATAPAVIAATVAVLGLGLWGLSQRSALHRRYLLIVLAVGMLVMSLGFVSTWGPAWASWTQSLLDGPLAPFRNIHKFDPLVRLPVAIGVGYAVRRLYAGVGLRGGRTPRLSRRAQRVTTFVLLCLAAAYAAPMVTGSSAASPRASATTTWWAQTGQWLDENADGARALVVPGSPSPTYLWGRTGDEPLQPATSSPWTTRSGIPLTPAGYIRFLDLVEHQLAAGTVNPHLAAALSNAGVGYVVLRNDLDSYASSATPREVVRATLASSPGFELTTTFGPDTTFERDDNDLMDGGMTQPRPAVEIWTVTPQPTPARLVPADQVVTANGSSDNLSPQLANLIGPQPTVVFGPTDSLPATGPSLLTDGIRKQQAFFGSSFTKSKTLNVGSGYLGTRAAYDYLPPDAPLSGFRIAGIKDVYATSSGDSIYAAANSSPLNGPWSALDGSPVTAWYSASALGAIGEALRVDFDGTWSGSGFTMKFPPDLLAYPTALNITTDAGTTRVSVQPNDESQFVAIDVPETSFLTVQAAVLDRADAVGTYFAISDLKFSAVLPQRYLVIPGEHAASHVHFERSPGARPECRTVEEHTYCDSAATLLSEEHYEFAREFSLVEGGSIEFAVTALLQRGPALNQLLAGGSAPAVTTSGTISADPRVQGGGALDDDPSTYWQTEPGDARPWLQVDYAEPVTTDGLEITVDESDPLPQPRTVRVTAGEFIWTGTLPEDGEVEFGQQITTSSIRVQIRSAELRTSTSSFDLRSGILPAGISQLSVNGAPAPAASESVVIPCGYGPAVSINGTVLQTEITADRADVLAGLPVTATACGEGSPSLRAGTNQVVVSGTAVATPVSIDMHPPGAPLGPVDDTDAAGSAQIQSWDATHRMVQVDATADSLLVIPENANPGWRATVDGRVLAATTVNGWQQAYVVPAGTTGVVELVFEPAGTVRAGLVGGGLLLLVLGGLCLIPFRRDAALPPAEELAWGRLGRIGGAAGLVLLGYQLVGLLGLIAGIGLIWGVPRLRHWLSRPVAQLLPGLLLLAATAYVLIPDRDGILERDREMLPALLTYGAVVTCCVLAVAAWRRPDR
ncbi:alpha-(1-_3)-arabinofuranosyltransferase family protein [Blastococcus sp. Marseille-P5729]|uniref:alpha-(1->3)-arabinofuranosyltransferase domain-containing protein n=1 Tax=Blastococcus sp. Marseille-P5729 TaxID=2086582 RepID=UPI000D112A1F|nr:alpha-(1->3)-arabinofuranosyltransferase family protein [Blastococcus sp. Marseille-P5729]